MLPWHDLLHGRSGWHALELPDDATRTLFLYHHRGDTWCVDMTALRGRRTLGFAPGDTRGFLQGLCRVRDLVVVEDVLAVYELAVKGVARRSGLWLQVAQGWHVVDALPRKRRSHGAADEAAEALGEEASASDSDASRVGRDEADAEGSDSGSACSLDTDAD